MHSALQIHVPATTTSAGVVAPTDATPSRATAPVRHTPHLCKRVWPLLAADPAISLATAIATDDGDPSLNRAYGAALFRLREMRGRRRGGGWSVARQPDER